MKSFDARVMCVAVGGVLVLLAAGGGFALASDGSGSISACVKQKTHLIYTGRCHRGDKQLTWNRTGPAGIQGPRGLKGAQGMAGQAGLQGVQGPPGPFPATLPSGKTLTGVYHTSDDTTLVTDTQSFAFPLASRPTVHFVGLGATPPAACPGSADNPQAAPGNLCVYASIGDISATGVTIANPETNIGGQASPRGFMTVEQNNPSFSGGSWAVTAP